jgi:ubiquinone biosynthesis monooxygenase Coq7
MDEDQEGALRKLGRQDVVLAELGRWLSGADPIPGGRENPGDAVVDEIGAPMLAEAERRQSGALMRVNHVGEICAQALYQGHALTIGDPALAVMFRGAAAEERDHLAWTRARLDELGDRPSRLNPLWYTGSLAIGALAGLAGRTKALGFMAETERQVEAHLNSHLDRLPMADTRSRAIVEQMRVDEARHADHALAAGGVRPPPVVAGLMKLAGRVMTTVAYRI